jgi:hypothetical protein
VTLKTPTLDKAEESLNLKLGSLNLVELVNFVSESREEKKGGGGSGDMEKEK